MKPNFIDDFNYILDMNQKKVLIEFENGYDFYIFCEWITQLFSMLGKNAPNQLQLRSIEFFSSK